MTDPVVQKLLAKWLVRTEEPSKLLTVVAGLSERGFAGEWDERGMRLHHPDLDTDRITFTFGTSYHFLIDGAPYGGTYSFTFPPHTPPVVILATIDAALKMSA